jgi:hypothetical protein
MIFQINNLNTFHYLSEIKPHTKKIPIDDLSLLAHFNLLTLSY